MPTPAKALITGAALAAAGLLVRYARKAHTEDSAEAGDLDRRAAASLEAKREIQRRGRFPIHLAPSG